MDRPHGFPTAVPGVPVWTDSGGIAGNGFHDPPFPFEIHHIQAYKRLLRKSGVKKTALKEIQRHLILTELGIRALFLCRDLDIENGVYASRVVVEGEEYRAMTNIGVRPSVDGTKRLLETHLFGFRGLLYGLKLRVELYEKIRDEKKFASVEELRQQIEKDSNKIKELMANG